MAKIFAALCIAGFALGASATELRFDFSKTKLGETPPGFSNFSTGGDPAKWVVAEEKVPPLLAPIETNSLENAAKREVLTVQSFDLGEKHSPVLIYTNEVLSDFVFTTRFKISGGIVEPSAGLIFRAQDQSNYYCVRASAQGYLLWYKVVNGQSYEGQGIGVKMPMPEDQWRELRIECNGSRMRCVLDGKLVLPPPREGSPTNNLAINDTTFTRGKIGFWSRADTKCFFVDADVEYTQRVPYIQVAVNNIIKRHQPILGIKVYARKNDPTPVIIGCSNEKDFGTTGSKTEVDVLDKGNVYFLKKDKTVEVTMPLRDRNGDIVAALAIKMKGFKGETQDTAVARATVFKKELELEIGALQDING